MSRFAHLRKISRKIILRGGLFLLTGAFFHVSAQTTDLLNFTQGLDKISVGYDQQGLKNFAAGAEHLLKVLYLLLRPLLAAAGAALDNSLVYGDKLHLTEALWKFWQFMRTFANFTIGFYFVISILMTFFGAQKGGATRVKDLIKNTLIAGVLVNMSRWMMGGLIDLSSITTVALGGLPLYTTKASGQQDLIRDKIYYLKPYIKYSNSQATEKQADTMETSLLYGCTPNETAPTRFYLACPIDLGKLFTKGPVEEPLTRESYKQQFIDVRKDDKTVKTDQINDDFCVYNNQLISYDEGKNINNCKEWQTMIANGQAEGMSQCAKVSDLLTKASGSSGILFALFNSVLHMADLGVTTNNGDTTQVVLEIIIKIVFGFALIIPLFALAIILILRVIILRLIITFSPIILLLTSMNWSEKLSSKLPSAIKDAVSRKEILHLIFLPTFVVFALSISIIFLSLLSNLPLIEKDVGRSETATDQADGCYNDVATALGIAAVDRTDPSGKTYDLPGGPNIHFKESARNLGSGIVNILSRLIINSFGVALMRMVVFMALKSSSFTKGIIEGIEKTAKDALLTAPLIPLSGGNVGFGALGKVPGQFAQKYDRKADEQYQNLGLENLATDRAASADGSTKQINNTYAKLADNPTTPESQQALNNLDITNPDVQSNTDFNDYPDAARAFAQKAKAYYTTANAGSPGHTFAQTHSSSITNLDNITSRDQALSNPAFVNRMQTQGQGKGYDEFLRNRDKSSYQATRRKNQATLEQGIKSIAGNQEAAPKITSSNTMQTIYRYGTKATQFTYDSQNNVRIKTIDLAGKRFADLLDSDLPVLNHLFSNSSQITNLATIPLVQELQTKNSGDEEPIAGNKRVQINKANNGSVALTLVNTP